MDWRIELAIAVIERDLASPLRVETLARRVNLSRSRFTHLFCHETGVGPGRYLRQVRLARAGELLAQTTLSVKEIMAAVGFNDPSHFTRDFQRVHGLSPRRFRARARSPGHVGALPALAVIVHRRALVNAPAVQTAK